jgi:hypothetical protein
MRSTRSILGAGLLLYCGYAVAQQKPYTDLSLDHLTGPVRAAVSKRSFHESDVRLPDGVSVVLPIMRERFEYDPDGTKTLGETQQQGGPYGESMEIERDAQGRLYVRRTLDRQTGQMIRDERFGPHGVIDDRRYSAGKLTDEFVQDWDENGHRSASVAKDGHGKEVSHGHSTFTADGVMTEETSWGSNGIVEWSNTYDPATDVLHSKNYDKNGMLRLSSTVVHDRLTDYWASEDNLYGSDFEVTAGMHHDESICHADGKCDHLVSEYLDTDGRNPRSVELRGPTGVLKAAAYYEYTLDTYDNWTNRIVRVKVTDKQQPVLYEEDARTLLYWPKR